MASPRVVVLGGGFGGLEVVRRLAPAARRGELQLALVDRGNAFCFTPLLPEVAVGAVEPRHVLYPLRSFCAPRGVRFVRAEVEAVDLERRRVRLAGPGLGPGTHLEWDRLVVALGATTESFGIPGAARHALPLKSVADAIAFRQRLVEAWERADVTLDREAQARAVSFVVVGAGVTGVELCSAMCRMFARTMRALYPAVPPDAVRVTLLEAGEQLLANVRAPHRQAAETHLRELGVQVRCRTRVRAVHADHLELEGGEILPSTLCAWTAGVRAATPLEGWPEWPAGRAGRVAVAPTLEVPGSPEVWLIGDGAAHALGEGRVTPMTAQVAVQMGHAAARNVRRSIGEHGAGRAGKPFRWRDVGMFVGLGPRSTFATVFGVPVSGRLAWLAWALVYMVKMVSVRRQIEIAFDFLKGALARHDTSLTLPTGVFGPMMPEDASAPTPARRPEIPAG